MNLHADEEDGAIEMSFLQIASDPSTQVNLRVQKNFLTKHMRHTTGHIHPEEITINLGIIG